MPIKHSSNTTYENEAGRFLSVDLDVEPLIRGIEDPERIRLWWNQCCKMGIEGEVRDQIKERMQYLKGRSE